MIHKLSRLLCLATWSQSLWGGYRTSYPKNLQKPIYLSFEPPKSLRLPLHIFFDSYTSAAKLTRKGSSSSLPASAMVNFCNSCDRNSFERPPKKVTLWGQANDNNDLLFVWKRWKNVLCWFVLLWKGCKSTKKLNKKQKKTKKHLNTHKLPLHPLHPLFGAFELLFGCRGTSNVLPSSWRVSCYQNGRATVRLFNGPVENMSVYKPAKNFWDSWNEDLRILDYLPKARVLKLWQEPKQWKRGHPRTAAGCFWQSLAHGLNFGPSKAHPKFL